MTWVCLGKNDKLIENPLNHSKYARHKSTKLWINEIYPLAAEAIRKKKNNEPQSDKYWGYTDLRDFANDTGFTWPRPLPNPVPLGQTQFERQCLVPFPRDFRDILEDVLGDIARVAIAEDISPPKNLNDPWKLPKNGFVGVYFGNSESREVDPIRFRELAFYFYGGSGGKFYRWQMRYEGGNNALNDLVISNTGAFRSVTKLSDSVWAVDRTDGGQVVIKYETCDQSFNEYKSRYEYIFWLARGAFSGVPHSALLTKAELQIISRLTVPDDSPQRTLAYIAQYRLDNAESHDHFTKMTPVDMGANLEKRLDQIRDGKMTSDTLRAFLFVPAKLRILGAIAVFDLIVTNHDRFSHRDPAAKYRSGVPWFGLKNVDFLSTGEPAALDNVTPNTPWIVANKWPGEVNLNSAANQKAYATSVLQTFREETKAVYSDEQMSDFANAFYEGMREGTRKLTSIRPELLTRVKNDTDTYGIRIGKIIADRIYATAF